VAVARRFCLPLLAVGVGAVASAIAGASQSSARSVGAGSLAFVANDPLGIAYGIARIGRDGSGQRLISSRPSGATGVWQAADAAWSPDGRWLAFDAENDIWIMKRDGSASRRITSGAETDDSEPAWSPNGRQIAFTRYHVRSDRSTIAVVDVTGGNADEITAGASPSWAPDGSRLVFVRGDFQDSEIFVADADGSNVRRLTSAGAGSSDPAWSPSGREIAFAGNGDMTPSTRRPRSRTRLGPRSGSRLR